MVCRARLSSFVRVSMLLLLASAAGCATARVGPTTAPPGTARTVVERARTFAGTAYRAGGSSPGGFDCSGFVQYLYGQVGISLPRTASEQFEVGLSVKPSRLVPGDLVFFKTEGRRVTHVGVVVGDGTFIHAPNTRSRVRIDRLDGRYWQQRYAGARRIAP
jgi:cell wall-associated NlpC family hydrolase